MISIDRYERIREMLRNRVLATAQKNSIRFGGLNSYTDVSNLLGPSLQNLFGQEYGQNYLERNAKNHLSALWALRKYLKLIKKYPSFREDESRSFPEKGYTCAFPDIREGAENM